MARVLLVKPPTGDIYGVLKEITPEYPPLGLAYIAAFLESRGHEIRIIDLSVELYTAQSLCKEVDKFSPSVVGITANTPTADNAYSIIDNLRKTFPRLLYVLGGPHPTALPYEALQHADVVVRGEAEQSFLELVTTHQKHGFNLKEFSRVNGISFKSGKKFINTCERLPEKDLDKYPLPARHLLKMDKYHYFGARRHPLTNIVTSRGCPFRCSYCNKNISGYVYRKRSAANILAELNMLVADYGISEIHISDDTFSMDKNRVLDFCNLVRHERLDLAFYPHNGLRVDSINRELLAQMRSIGFYAMVFGVESGNQQILNNIGKGITLQQVRDAFKLAKRFNYETWGFFILGLKGETRQTAMDTIRFARELDPDVAKFHILVPYPGTPDYERLKNRMLVKKWSDFSIFNRPTFRPENMTEIELYDLFKLAFRSYYLRPKPIFRTVLRSCSSPRALKESFKAGLSVCKTLV
ncbi:MAG: radical SAM protein [Candidatus Woesearchaeota archaeon]